MADLKLSAIYLAAVSMLLSRASKSDSKVFYFSDKFQRCAIVREGGNRRVTPAKEDNYLVLSVLGLSPLKRV